MNERIGAQVKLRQRPGGFWRKRGRRRCIFDLLFVEQSQQHQQRPAGADDVRGVPVVDDSPATGTSSRGNGEYPVRGTGEEENKAPLPALEVSPSAPATAPTSAATARTRRLRHSWGRASPYELVSTQHALFLRSPSTSVLSKRRSALASLPAPPLPLVEMLTQAQEPRHTPKLSTVQLADTITLLH
ncbi:hypothetical protein BD626DRAFT_576114 [Schizophyllum amplum]|uniref:Uncharacterized protein n=1 Tax=Schizophyllum amplum TaxID=97359 RepID=A0A550BU77_9AGAR|nr:hypothetical protein BD626DRAFT_576114 [Auriculariopsis ampla]